MGFIRPLLILGVERYLFRVSATDKDVIKVNWKVINVDWAPLQRWKFKAVIN